MNYRAQHELRHSTRHALTIPDFWPGRSVRAAKKLKTLAPGRICAQKGCQTRLSVYNLTPICDQCTRRLLGQNALPTPAYTVRTNHCKHCGVEYPASRVHYQLYCSEACRKRAYQERQKDTA